MSFQAKYKLENYTLICLLQKIHDGSLILSPKFQRNFVWPEPRQKLLVDSVLSEYYIGTFHLAFDQENHIYETVDGRQRLETIFRFAADSFYIIRSDDDKRYKYSTLLPRDRRIFDNTQISCVILDKRKFTDAEMHDQFKRVNSGMAVTAPELLNAMSHSPVVRKFKLMSENLYAHSFKDKHLRHLITVPNFKRHNFLHRMITLYDFYINPETKFRSAKLAISSQIESVLDFAKFKEFVNCVYTICDSIAIPCFQDLRPLTWREFSFAILTKCSTRDPMLILKSIHKLRKGCYISKKTLEVWNDKSRSKSKRTSQFEVLCKMGRNKRRRVPKIMRKLLWDKHYPGLLIGKCYVCNCRLDNRDYEAGHVKSHAKGGSTTLENLRPICSTCNKSMGTDDLNDFKITYNLGDVLKT